MTAVPRRLRLAVVTWFYDNQPGVLDFRLRIHALARSHDVTLISRSRRFDDELQGPPMRCETLPVPRTGRGALLKYCAAAAMRCRRLRPDAVVLLGSQLATVAWWLPRGLPAALYWNEHPTHFLGTGAGRGPRAWLARAALRASYAAAARSRLVMPIGEAHAEDLAAHGVPAARTRLIYMGVGSGFRRRPPGPDAGGPLRLVYTGSVAAERGRDVMLEGVALARERGLAVHLTLVGASEAELAYGRERIAALGLDGWVDLHGRVTGDRIPDFLARADLGLCLWEDRPWWRFNPPTKLFEYLVAGLPVLVSDIRTHTDYVRSGFNGLVFAYGAQGLADAVAQVQARRAELPRWSAQAAADGERFLWSRIEPDFLAAIAGLDAKGRA